MANDSGLANLGERLNDPQELKRFLTSFVNHSLLVQASAFYFLHFELNLLKADGLGPEQVAAAQEAAARRVLGNLELYKDVYGEDAWPAVREMLAEIVAVPLDIKRRTD